MKSSRRALSFASRRFGVSSGYRRVRCREDEPGEQPQRNELRGGQGGHAAAEAEHERHASECRQGPCVREPFGPGESRTER